jgi:hypothetical protein
MSAWCWSNSTGVDKAVACHDTPAYKEALKALGTGNVEAGYACGRGRRLAPSPLRKRIALMRGLRLALRVGNDFEKYHDERYDAPKAGERRHDRGRMGNVAIGLILLDRC